MPSWRSLKAFSDRKRTNATLPAPKVDNVADRANDDDGHFGMKVLVDKPPESAQLVDVIAIHGLNGHYSRTWTATTATGEVNWLRDFLPEQIPNARVLTYSYNSAVQFSKSMAGIDTFAEQLLEDLMSWRVTQVERDRPIVFICHSLGGIIFKQAVNRANERDRYSDLLSRFTGAFFFGTPHRGSDLALWGQMFGNILKAASFGTSTNTKILSELATRSEILRKISTSFVGRGRHLSIFSFYETESMPNLNCKVVEADSAILDWPNETSLGINGNHRTICRFTTPSAQGYRNVWTNLQNMIAPSLDRPLSEEEKACLLSFYTSDYEFHKKRNDPPVDGTCLWFLKHEKFKSWQESQSSKLLWVSADPGCGKSVLASFLVDTYQARAQQAGMQLSSSRKDLSNVCYFFFKDDSDEQKSSVYALSAILHQIFCLQPILLKHAVLEQSKKGHVRTRQFHALWNIFKTTIEDEEANNMICFIDGLDECEESSRDELTSALAEYFALGQDHLARRKYLKVFITSRPDNSIKEMFENRLDVRLKGEDETELISQDVELVVQDSVKGLANSGLPEKLLKNLQQQLIEGADRTFLWVTLIIKLLKDASKRGATDEELDDIIHSRDIDAVYARLLNGRDSPADAKKMLFIVIAAARPLSLDEISIAMAISRPKKAAEPEFDLHKQATKFPDRFTAQTFIELPPDSPSVATPAPSNRRKIVDSTRIRKDVPKLDDLGRKIKHPFDNYVYTLCGHFLRIVQSRIYLVHQTAREFLIQSKSPPLFRPISDPPLRTSVKYEMPGILWQHSISLSAAHYVLLVICTEYLRLFASQSEIKKRKELGSAYRTLCLDDPVRKFFTYAALYWPVHYRHGDENIKEVSSYEELCDPSFGAFELWTAEHGSYKVIFPAKRVQVPGSIDDPFSFHKEVLEFFGLRKAHHAYFKDKEFDNFLNETGLSQRSVEALKKKGSLKANDGTREDAVSSEESLAGNSSMGMSHRVQHEYRIWRQKATGTLPVASYGMSHPPAGHSFPEQMLLDQSLTLRPNQSGRPDLIAKRKKKAKRAIDVSHDTPVHSFDCDDGDNDDDDDDEKEE